MNIRDKIYLLLNEDGAPSSGLAGNASGIWDGVKSAGENIRAGASNVLQKGAAAVHNSLGDDGIQGVAKHIIHPLTSEGGAAGAVAAATGVAAYKTGSSLLGKTRDLKNRITGGGGGY